MVSNNTVILFMMSIFVLVIFQIATFYLVHILSKSILQLKGFICGNKEFQYKEDVQKDLPVVIQKKRSFLLNNEEKAYRLEKLVNEINAGKIGEEMMKYIVDINTNPKLCIVSCCAGKIGNSPFVSIRTSYSFEELFTRLSVLVNDNTLEVHILQEFGMPRYSFVMKKENWENTMEKLINLLKQ